MSGQSNPLPRKGPNGDAISEASRIYMTTRCLRCDHGPDWHRCDDSKHYDITDPATPFRCHGPGFDGCTAECPDFIPSIPFDRLVEEAEARNG